MYSTEPNEYEYCEKLYQSGMTISDAVNQTSMHFYGEQIREFESHLASL
nr:IncF plasmid conjugative transfer pilus assemblyprotein TraC [Vibrio splendidus]